MRNYTLRNLPPELWTAITDLAEREGVSRREAVIRLLERGLQSPQTLARRGGTARQQALTAAQRRSLAQAAARARWGPPPE